MKRLLLILAASAACGGGARAPRASPHELPAPTPPPPTPTHTQPAPPLAALAAAVATRGEIVSTPVLFDGQWIVFVGTPRVTQAAFSVSLATTPAKIERLLSFPLAAKVVTTAQHGGHLYALVESVAWHDQPPGMRTFVRLDPSTEPERRLDERAAIAVGPPEGLAARIAAAHAPIADDTSAPDALVAQLKGGLVSSLAPDVAIGREWPPFFESVPRPDANVLTKLGGRVFQCLSNGCQSFDANDRLATLHVVDRGGKRVVAAIALTPPRSRPREPVKPHVVNPVQDDGRLARAVRLLGIEGARILGAAPLDAAPLGAGGMLAVITTGDGSLTYKLVVVDDDVIASAELNASFDEKGLGIGFADIDGDGRTDLVMSGSGGPPKATGARIFITPSTTTELDGVLIPEPIGFFALRGARSLEEARARALALPSGGVTRDEACPLLRALSNAASASKVMAPRAALFTYNEPGWFEGSAKRASLQRVLGPTPCDDLECSESRPTCKRSDPPLTDYFLFRRDRGVLEIAGVIRYTGG